MSTAPPPPDQDVPHEDAGETHDHAGFADEDRRKTNRGTVLSLVGGLVLAGVRALGFFLRAIFGGEMWGLYAIAWSFVELLAFFVLGGFNDAVVIFSSRAYAAVEQGNEDREGHIRALATCIKVPFALALIAATCLTLFSEGLYHLVWSDHDPLLVTLVQELSWCLPLLVLLQVPAEATRATLRFGYAIGIVQIAFPVLSLVLAITLFYTVEPTILAIVRGTLAAAFLCIFASFWALWSTLRAPSLLRELFSVRVDREVLRFAFPQSLNMALNQGLNRIDALMLSFFGVSANLIGVYTLVSDLTQLIRLAKMAFSGVYSPLVAKYRAIKNHLGVIQALDDTTRKSSSISLALLILFMCTWPLFIFDANETWTDSVHFPWLLCAGPLMSAFFGLCGNTLLMYGHSRLLLLNAIGAGSLNLLLNYLLIPPLGLFGAALATAISNISISVAQMVELAKIEKIRVRWDFYRRTLLAGILPVAVVFWLTSFVLPVTGPFGAWPTWATRSGLALGAILFYVLLQLSLPGKPPFRLFSKKDRDSERI